MCRGPLLRGDAQTHLRGGCPLGPGAASLAPSPRVLGRGPTPSPAVLIAPDNSGPGLRPTAAGCRPRPLVVRGSGQWAGPPHPPLLGVILGPSTRPNPALQRAEFFRIFGACGAAPRGGGGAPPTTLILLRNQRNPSAAAARPPTCPGRPVPAPPGTPFAPSGRSPPPLLAGLVDLAAAARGRGQGGRRAIRRRGPTAWDSRPIPCPGLGLTTARVSRSLKAGLEPTGISMSSVRTVVPS